MITTKVSACTVCYKNPAVEGSEICYGCLETEAEREADRKAESNLNIILGK